MSWFSPLCVFKCFLAAVRSWAEPYLVNNLGLLQPSIASPWQGCPHIGSYSIQQESIIISCIYLWQIPIIRKSPSSRQSWGRNAKMFVPPSIFSPSIYPGSYPRHLSQVLLINLLLNLPPNLPTQVASPGTSSRYSLPTRTTVLDGWWQCFLKLLLLFCPRSFLSQSFPSWPSVLCEKYEKYKNRWTPHLQST